MGAGILPTTIHNGKLYFLFGKENKYEDSADGYSDFGGGTDNSESFIDTAVREAGEELTGFLGNSSDIKKLLKRHGTYNIDYKSDGFNKYRMHIFPFNYDPYLPYYYNNNQKFIQTHLSGKIIKHTKIFEKEKIKWVCVDDLKSMRPQFRSYFRNIVDMMLAQQQDIRKFILKGLKKMDTHKKQIYKSSLERKSKNTRVKRVNRIKRSKTRKNGRK